MVWIRLSGSGLALVVFPRSRLCLLHENYKRLQGLLEMASTVRNGIDCYKWNRPFTKGKVATVRRQRVTCLMILNYSINIHRQLPTKSKLQTVFIIWFKSDKEHIDFFLYHFTREYSRTLLKSVLRIPILVLFCKGGEFLFRNMFGILGEICTNLHL